MEQNLENVLLSKYDLMDYDLERTYFRVIMFMKEYKRLQSKSYGEPQLIIGPRFKFDFVDERTRGINDVTSLDRYIDDETDYKRYSKKICFAISKMTEEEKAYYTYCLYQNKSDTKCSKEIGVSPDGLKPIKKSCIVKFATVFDLEVLKDDVFSEEEAEKFDIFNAMFEIRI